MTTAPADLLLRIASHPRGARWLRRFGLPAPVALQRCSGGWRADELAGHALVAAGLGESPGLLALTAGLQALGAQLREAADGPVDGILVDARQLARPDGLQDLQALFSAWLPRLAPRGRIVLLGPLPAPGASPPQVAAAHALGGLVRSLGKEIGRRGAAVNQLCVPASGSPALAASVAFLLSRRSGFVAGQTLHLAPPDTDDDAAAATAGWQPAALAGQLAVVTGAARGIGRATAQRLAEEGARVLCVDMPASAAELTALATGLGGQALALDITAGDAGSRLASAVQALGGADIVVHNAGITRDRTLARMRPAEWEAVLAVNLEAVIALDAALDDLAGWRPGARTVCLSSINGLAGAAGQTNYAAAKAGLVGYVQARAARLAPHGAAINAVAPGFIETAMTAQLPWQVALAGRRLSALGQGGLPRDVAEAITFLALPCQAAINGQVLRVCGQSFVGA